MEDRALLVCYTDRGKEKMEEIRGLLERSGRTVLALERPKGGAFLQEYWQQVREIVFIGAAGIAVWLGRKLGREVSKHDGAVEHLREWVDAQYESGRVTNIGDEELEREYEKYLEACKA